MDEQHIIGKILQPYAQQGILFHALRTRQAGLRRFVSLHVLVPGEWTVQQGHDVCEAIELAISRALPESNVITHLEPLEDPMAFADQGLDRETNSARVPMANAASKDALHSQND